MKSALAKLAEFSGEMIIIVIAIASLATMPRLLHRASFLGERQRLFYFEATGTVDELTAVDGSYHLRIVGRDATGRSVSYSVISRALQECPRELQVGATFQKAYGSAKCRINGQEYDFYTR